MDIAGLDLCWEWVSVKCKVVELIELSSQSRCSWSLDCILLVLKNINGKLVAKSLFSTSVPTSMADTNHGWVLFIASGILDRARRR